jgi:hypothetical protein
LTVLRFIVGVFFLFVVSSFVQGNAVLAKDMKGSLKNNQIFIRWRNGKIGPLLYR